MNKEIKINKDMKILFVIDIFVFITMFLFRYVYTNIGYYYNLINISLALNIIFFICLIAYTVYLILGNKSKKYLSLIIFSLFLVYILFNTIGIILINKPVEKKYKSITKKIISYCQTHSCDTYETKYLKNKRKLVIQKKYFDYDNNENDILIETLYNKDGIISTKVYIDSSSNLFSEEIIKNELDSYFEMYDKEIKEEYIEEAFENRFKSSIKHDNMTYKVSEVYDDDNNLTKLKTIITLKIN